MQQSTHKNEKLNVAHLVAMASAFCSPFLFLVCLRLWASPHPWARLNLFSGAFIALASISYIEQSVTFLRSAFRSRETFREAVGATYDPVLVKVTVVLGFLDYAILFEYAHLHLVPALEQPPLQWAGLMCAAGSLGMLLWADAWLGRHFAKDEAARTLMSGGPYRFVRHPRYVSIILAKLASPFLLGSVLAWIALPMWIALVLRRIPLEEAHVRKAFGAAYDAYAARTARLLPGIY
jgi:protein-S-isoprenylcysteine O-methyltransferase Ste14